MPPTKTTQKALQKVGGRCGEVAELEEMLGSGEVPPHHHPWTSKSGMQAQPL